jgi:hypothetical protein
MSTANVFANEPPTENSCQDDPRACFDGFTEDGKIKPKSDKVERTFSFPPIKAGFIFDAYNRDLLPHLSVEALDFDVPYVGDITWDFGVATSRLFTSFTWEFIPIVKVGPSIWAGYNVKHNSVAFGVGVSLLSF